MDEKKSFLWFSVHFGIHQPQYKLPFVDFPLDSDVPLYLDSYAITKDGSEMSAHCHNAITSYFQAVLDAVKQKDEQRVQYLIRDRLSEPKEIHLGVSKKARAGVGLGPVQEGQIIRAITHSTALASGAIQDIQELELHIDGVGSDKVSDLIANIIKGYLAEFTQEMCTTYNIATIPCTVNFFWDSDALEWTSDRYHLPARGGDYYLLVPKDFVRREQDLANHQTFYKQYMLDFYIRERQSGAASLTATLQTQTPRVTKASLRKDPSFPSNKASVSSFIQEHPDIIEQYREKLRQGPNPMDYAALSGRTEIDDHMIQETLEKLDKTPADLDHAQEYQDLIRELLLYVFDWYLDQVEDGRIDIKSENYAKRGLFKELRDRFQATSIPLEYENGNMENNTFRQFADRLSPETSLFGFFFCRRREKPEEISYRVSELFMMDKKCILVFDDQILKGLVEIRRHHGYKGLESLLRKMIRHVRYGPDESTESSQGNTP